MPKASAMPRMMSLLVLICLLGLTGVAPRGVQAGQMDTVTRTFATCTGRLSALMEHQWLLSDGAADTTRAQRAMMIDLLQAAMPRGTEREALALRIEAKQAQHNLLMQASFGQDRPAARQAAARALQLLRGCTALIGTETALRAGRFLPAGS